MRFRSSYWSDSEDLPNEGGHIDVDCAICGVATHATVIATCTTPASRWLRLPKTGMKVINYLVQCTRCDAGMLVAWSRGDDRRLGNVTAGIFRYPYKTSPSEAEALKSGGVPASILLDLEQAELCMDAAAHHGAGLVLRRLCQNVCREQKIPEPTSGGLKAQLNELAEKGTITKALAEMTDTVRIIGNELAHPDPDTPLVIEPDDVRAAREFAGQLIEAVYVGPARARKLREDLAKKGVR